MKRKKNTKKTGDEGTEHITHKAVIQIWSRPLNHGEKLLSIKQQAYLWFYIIRDL